MPEKYYVYFYYDKNDELLYIGQAKKGVYERWQSHTESWKDEVFTIGVREYEDEAIMDVFESYYIKRYSPTYNKARLKQGHTKCDINDNSTLKKYSIDEFCANYGSKQKKNNSKLDEKIKEKGIEIIETNKIDLFDKELLSNTNLDKIWFKYENFAFLFEFADINYRRKKDELEALWLSNNKLHSFKKAVCAMEERGLDVTAQQYNFDSAESREFHAFKNKFVSFEQFTFKIFLLYEGKSGELKRKSAKNDIFVGYKEQTNIYKEKNNNVVYLISSNFYPHNKTGWRRSDYQPEFYTVKDFIEISSDNFIVNLENFKNIYIPNKEKAENESYEKMKSEPFRNYIKQIQDEEDRKIKQEWDEREKSRQSIREIKNAYWDCVEHLKNSKPEEKKFLIKVTRFEYTSNPEIKYSLEEIKNIKEKIYGFCTSKQYNFIKELAIKWGLKIKPNVFIPFKKASEIISILKSNSLDNVQNIVDNFFEQI